MKIAIIGYGKMGNEVEIAALERGHEISAIVNNNTDSWHDADIAIEFTSQKACISNFKKAFDKNIPIVTGSTGWYSQIDEIKALCKKSNQSFLYASNFSIGVNLFFKLNSYLAKLMNSHKEYNSSIEEIHHTEKKDSPSGTAITLANGIIESTDSKSNWVNTHSDDGNELSIISKREEKVPGTHLISYKSEIDEIEIKHTAYNRRGFAIGAVIAAEWLLEKKGFYNIQDMMHLE